LALHHERQAARFAGAVPPLRNEIRRAIDQDLRRAGADPRPAVERFERNLADYCQTKHAIGVSSGTDALLCSLMAIGVGARR
jgi:dTDP-4-amino-4,6-dideoxygalactose transaminase